MSEQRQPYRTKVLQGCDNRATMSTDTDALFVKARHVKVQLLSLLVELDKYLGDEPSVMTRAERRRG